MGKAVFTIWNVPYEQKNEKKIGSSENRVFTCFYAGRISKDTGVVAILEAFRIAKKQFEGLKLVLIGRLDIDNITYKDMLSTSKKFGDLVLLKAVSHDKLESLYLSADAGLALYPPTYWTFRTKASEKVFEYMSYSLPVITSNFPGLREIINSTNSGLLINPSDPESISNAILMLCRNQQYAKLLGTNGRKAISSNYNWDKQKATLFEAYYYVEHGYLSSRL